MLAVVLGAVLSTPPAQAVDIGLTGGDTPTVEKIVPGQVMVKFDPGTSQAARDQTLAAVNGTVARTPTVDEDFVVITVPLGTEVASAASLEVDPTVIDAAPVGR